MNRGIILIVLLVGWSALAPAQQISVGRPTGPCVLLKNQNVVFGMASQLGRQIIVRRDDGSELRLAVDQVCCWGDSLAQLHDYRLDHRQNGSLRIHLDDARWCLKYGLLKEAGTELQKAYRLDPTNAVAITLEQELVRASQRQLAQFSEPPSTMARPLAIEAKEQEASSDLLPNRIGLVSYQTDAQDSPDVSTKSLAGFAKRVQPVILNRCASCHHQKAEACEWKLIRPAGGMRASQRVTKANLESVLPYVVAGSPGTSEFIRRASDGHSGDLRQRPSQEMVDTLRDWIAGLAGQPNNRGRTVVGLKPAPTDSADLESVYPRIEDAPSDENGKVKRLPVVDNPFDPEIFNRRYHGESDAGESKE